MDKRLLKEAFYLDGAVIEIAINCVVIAGTILFTYLFFHYDHIFAIGMFSFGLAALIYSLAIIKNIKENYNFLLWYYPRIKRENELRLFSEDDFCIDTSSFD